MTIPRSSSWRILGFTKGMNIGPAPAGIEWFCGATDPRDKEGVEWQAISGGGWGVRYGRGSDNSSFWVSPAVFSSQHIQMLPFTVDHLLLVPLTAAEYGTLTFTSATKTITRATGAWTSSTPEEDYSVLGTKITITGSTSNDGTYTVVGLGATDRELVVQETLVDEGPTSAPTLTGTRAFQVRQWASTVRFRKPTNSVSVMIYGARPSDNFGGLGTASYDSVSDSWSFSLKVPTALGTADASLGSDVIVGDEVELTLVFVEDENAVHFWAGGKYRGSAPAFNLTPSLAWANTMGVCVQSSGFSVTVTFTSWLVGLAPGAGSIRPTSQAGPDKVVPIGRWCGFDAKRSSDPDDDVLGYKWKLIAAPSTSSFVVEGGGGSSTSPFLFVAPSLSALSDPIQSGDILMLSGVPYEIAYVDPGGTNLTVVGRLPAVSNANFLIIRQASCFGSTSRVFSFRPDVRGLFVASLRVWDPHGLFSDVDLAVCSSIQDLVPLGVPLDMGWMWKYLSDFWQIVEGKDWAPAAWMALARMVSALSQDLWNVDFDKSLATTQNVVVRRWLPYSPRLDEMDPDAATFHSRLAPAVGVDRRYTDNELDTRTLENPVTFSLISYREDGAHTLDVVVPAGTLYRDVPSVLNTALAATSDFSQITFTWRMTDPAFTNPAPPPATLKLYSLAGVSSQYMFSVSEDSQAFYRHQTDSALMGTSGVRLSSRVAWLDGLDLDGQIKVGDPINLGGRSFQVVAVTHRPGVAPTAPGYNPDGWTWIELEVDKDIPPNCPPTFPWCAPSYWKSARTPWWEAGFTPGDLVMVERRPASDDTAPALEVQMEVAAAGDRTIGTLNHEMFWPAYQWRLSYGRRHFYIKTDPRVLEIPRLQEAPDKPTWVMEGWNHHMVDDRRNGRYVILNFRSEPDSEMDSVDLYRDRGPLVFLGDYLWAEVTYWDNRQQIEANFGRMVGAYYKDFEAGIKTDYLSIVTGLWYVYANGPTPSNINTACAIISGYPYAEAKGTILALVENFMPGFSYALVRDVDQSAIVRSYVFKTGDGIADNPATGSPYKVGDTIERFALFVKAQIYRDYITDPDWWRSLVSGGSFEEPEKIHKFAVMLDIDFVDAALLTVVFNFLLDFKKSHTYPLFAGLLKRSTDVGIQDRVEITNTMSLPTSMWAYPVPQHLDRPRLGSGIEIRPAQSEEHGFFLVRPRNPGKQWIAIRLIEENGIGAPAPGTISVVTSGPWHLISVAYNSDTDRVADIVTRINADPAARLLVEAYLPPGAVVDLRPWSFDGKIRIDPVALGSAISFELDPTGPLGLTETPGSVLLKAPFGTALDTIIATINTSTQITAEAYAGPVSGNLESATPPFPTPVGTLRWNLHCGEDKISSDVGWSIVNYRGGFQLKFDGGGRTSPWMPGVLDEVSSLMSFNSVPTTISNTIGANVIGSVISGSGGKYRIRLASPGPVWFHASPGGGPPWQPAPTQLRAMQDWIVFYAAGSPPVIKSKGRILGAHTDRTAGTPARIEGTKTAPFGVPSMTLNLVDSAVGSVSVTVSAPAVDTADNWALAFSAALSAAGSIVAAKSLDGRLVFQTRSLGSTVSFSIVGGDACSTLGLVPGSFSAGTDDPFAADGYPNFYTAGGFNWVDVQMEDPEPRPPAAGDSFQIYRGMPDRAVMNFDGGTDTNLGASWNANYVSSVTDLGLVLDPITGLPDGTGRHRFQITLASGTGRQFNSGAGTPTALLPNQDWFWFFAGDWATTEMWPTPTGYGMLESVDGKTQATLITAVGSPVPSPGTFVVLRNPDITYLWNLWTAACGDGTMHLLTLPKPGVDVANFPPKASGKAA